MMPPHRFWRIVKSDSDLAASKLITILAFSHAAEDDVKRKEKPAEGVAEKDKK
jgi:hypothetical protein